MRDEETGSWWQQASGEAIFGPLKGAHLNLVSQDELTFAQWRQEQPTGRVLRPDPKVAAKNYPADWEAQVAKLPVVTPVDKQSPLPPRAIVIGIVVNGAAKAYPWELLQRQSPIIDTVGGIPVLVLLSEDRQSVRVFQRTVQNNTIELFARPDSTSQRLIDSDTGSEWDFTGRAISGTRTGAQLTPIQLLKDYWFDWHSYHPNTTVYLLGQ